MSMDYIRKYYGVPAKLGGRVAWDTSKGTRYGSITGATAYIYVRFDDAKHPVPLHPMEEGLRYLTPNAELRGRGARASGTRGPARTTC